MTSSTWSLSAQGKSAVLTFERPPRHTMTLASMTELAKQQSEIVAPKLNCRFWGLFNREFY